MANLASVWGTPVSVADEQHWYLCILIEEVRHTYKVNDRSFRDIFEEEFRFGCRNLVISTVCFDFG